MINQPDGIAGAPMRRRSAFAVRSGTFARRLTLATLLTLSAAFALTAASALAAGAPEKPLTGEAKSVTATTAILEKGELNPLAPGEPGEYQFFYRVSETECEGESAAPEAPGIALGAEKEPVPPVELVNLQPNQSYTFCLIEHNVEGPGPASTPVTFKTAAAPPSIPAEGAPIVKSTEATLEAVINPNNQETHYSIEYATDEALTAETTVAGENTISGFGEQGVQVSTGAVLTAGTTYFYRFVAENEKSEKREGPVQHFTTPPLPVAETPTPLGSTTATFLGHLSPLNETVATQYHFLYGLGGCTEKETPSEEAGTGAGTELVANPAPVTELQPNAEYDVCLVTNNESGSQESAPVPFKTLAAPPGIANQKHTAVTETGATLEAGINPNNQETNYVFEYSTSESGGELSGTIVSVPAAPPAPLSGFGEQAIAVPTETLLPRTEYFYRLVATNATAEVSKGPLESFSTLATPLVTTAGAAEITTSAATVSGTVNPGGLETTYHFAYVEAAKYAPGATECPGGVACAYAAGRSTPESESVGADYTAHAAGPLEISELKPGTTYDYTLVATNSQGSRVSANASFTTLPGTPPLVTTGAPAGVTQLNATLTGSVDTRGLATVAEFEFGTNPTAGANQRYPASETAGAGTLVNLSASFNNTLSPGTTYYYRVIASNADGEAAGGEISFATAGFPAAFTPPSPLAFVPYTTIAEIEAKERANTPPPVIVKPLTNAQKLAKALTVCHKDKKEAKRHSCEKQAHKKYGPFKKKKG
jgi:hypothetical protein